jgi:hypothetical protein
VPAGGNTTAYPAATCHDTGGVPSLAENKLIKGLYDQVDYQAGHQIRYSAKSVTNALNSVTGITQGDKMPCYNCHNPHGSLGSTEAGGADRNAYLISDQRANWYGIISPLGGDAAAATQVRRFCFGCHVASNGAAGSITVMGLNMNTIPNTVSAHSSADTTSNCYSCHASGTTTATAYAGSTSRNVHRPDVGGTCITCHDTGGPGTTGANTRRAIKPEFNLDWGHRNVSRAAVTPNDCGVCHMEGNPSTGATTADHNDGAIELRNPDSGLVMVTFNAGESFVRNVASNTIEPRATAVQNFCLACHDGAFSSSIVTPSGGTTNPWVNTNPAPLNVSAQFAITNATYHPVRGTQNNDHCDIDTMVAPWNGITKTVGGALEAGYLITCWDCHNKTTELAEGTVTAHGVAAANHLRATYDRTAGSPTQLCIECHKTLVYYTGASTDIAPSAFAVTPDGSYNAHPNSTAGRHKAAGTGFSGCLSCHSSSYNSQPARPRAAEDAHGYDTLAAGGSWAITGGATTGAKPFGFMRATNPMTSWRPKSWPGEVAGEGGGYCNASTPGSIKMCGWGYTKSTYTPGGAY